MLHGPPGCGKTDLAHAIANECGVPFLRISAPEIVAGVSGRHLLIPLPLTWHILAKALSVRLQRMSKHLPDGCSEAKLL